MVLCVHQDSTGCFILMNVILTPSSSRNSCLLVSKQSWIGSTGKGNNVSSTPVFVPLTPFAHLCTCCGSQCYYRSLNKRFQDLLVQLYQIHATCKCIYLLTFYCFTLVVMLAICYIYIIILTCCSLSIQSFFSFIFWKVHRGDLIWKTLIFLFSTV